MRPTEALKQANLADWNAAIHHPFCAQLAAGTLSLDTMRWYLVQDYQFIEGFVRLLASAISQAPSLADAVPMAQFLGLITSDENTYFLRSFEDLAVSDAARRAVPAAPTAGFQALMDQATSSGHYAQKLAVLVVAEWIYLDWATPFQDRADQLPFYFGEWITLHSGPGFGSVVDHLRSQLDSEMSVMNVEETADIEKIFGQAVKLERAFFDATMTSER